MGSEYIQAPANCHLFNEEYYSLHSDPQGLKIQPRVSITCYLATQITQQNDFFGGGVPPYSLQRALFFQNFGPNYHATFEIVLTAGTDDVNLMVQDPGRKPVWEYALHVPGKTTNSIMNVQ